MFSDAAGGHAVETLTFVTGAYCVDHREEFWAGDASSGAYLLFLTLSDPDGYRMYPGGPASSFVAPAAREHGVPPVAAVLPFVAGADGVPRLPRISGNPPFAANPEHDRAEFGRQVRGQESGLNGLTVAAFLRNRDQYLVCGRSSAGTQAQKKARAKALCDKTEELREQRGLSRTDATTEAKRWLGTQAALHDPDQIAGGHGFPIVGMGDSAVNSSIGAQWPSRIAPIDTHVRNWARGMSQPERETTFLNVELPWN